MFTTSRKSSVRFLEYNKTCQSEMTAYCAVNMVGAEAQECIRMESNHDVIEFGSTVTNGPGWHGWITQNG